MTVDPERESTPRCTPSPPTTERLGEKGTCHLCALPTGPRFAAGRVAGTTSQYGGIAAALKGALRPGRG
jgi:hypothetical protein